MSTVKTNFDRAFSPFPFLNEAERVEFTRKQEEQRCRYEHILERKIRYLRDENMSCLLDLN